MSFRKFTAAAVTAVLCISSSATIVSAITPADMPCDFSRSRGFGGGSSWAARDSGWDRLIRTYVDASYYRVGGFEDASGVPIDGDVDIRSYSIGFSVAFDSSRWMHGFGLEVPWYSLDGDEALSSIDDSGVGDIVVGYDGGWKFSDHGSFFLGFGAGVSLDTGDETELLGVGETTPIVTFTPFGYRRGAIGEIEREVTFAVGHRFAKGSVEATTLWFQWMEQLGAKLNLLGALEASFHDGGGLDLYYADAGLAIELTEVLRLGVRLRAGLGSDRLRETLEGFVGLSGRW